MAAPPTVEVNAQWRGLLLLGNMQAEHELALLIADVVPRFVDVFHLKGGDPGFAALTRDMGRMIDLYAEFLRIPGLAAAERSRADKELNGLRTAAREAGSAWSAVPAGKGVPLHVARAATAQISKFLHGMVMLTDVMETQQRKMLLGRVLQALQSVQLLREARSPETLQRHAPIFNSYFDALYSSLAIRLEALQQMGEQPHRMRTAAIMEGVQHGRFRLFSAMEGFVSDPASLDAATEVEQEQQRVTRALEELVTLLTAGVRASGAIDHQVFERGLDALAQALDARSPQAVAAAARDLVQEVKRKDGATPPPGAPPGDGDAAPRGGGERLKERVQDLLAATKAELAAPTPEHRERFNAELEAARREAEYDTIATTLLASGIIDAAAQVSAQLNALFAV